MTIVTGTPESGADEIQFDEVDEAARTALYRFYDAEDGLLYVGISDDPVSRARQHSREKDWWPEVARKTLVWYDSREAADLAETIAIGIERPANNKAKRYERLTEEPFPAPRVVRPAAPKPAPKVAARHRRAVGPVREMHAGDMTRPCGCEPVGQKEIAGRLGVEEDTVKKWRTRGIFPAPEPTLVGGRPWWQWPDIEQWSRETGHPRAKRGEAAA